MARDADRVKEAVGVETFARILENLGGVLSRTQRGRSSCPIHGGESADTLHFNERNGVIVWNCFKGCGKPGGDVFDLVANARGITFPEAVEWVGERVGVSDEKRPPRPAAAAPSHAWDGPPPDAYEEDAALGANDPEQAQEPAQKHKNRSSSAPVPEVGEARFERLKRLWNAFAKADEKAEKYLRGRGIEPDPENARFNLGTTGDEEVDQLARNGFRIAIPLRGPGGEIRSFSFRLDRDLSDAEKKAHPNWRSKTNLKGETGGAFYATEPVTTWGADDALLVTEGITDTLAVLGLGYLTTGKGHRVRVIGLPGAAQAVKAAEGLGADVLKGRHVLIALDRDAAGDGNAAQLARTLRSLGAKPYRVKTIEKDLCLELSFAPDSPMLALTRLIRKAGEEGQWNPDAPDAGAEWQAGLGEWEGAIESRGGVSTGMNSVDELLGGGLQDKRSYVFAGMSGSGKSALALTWTAHIAKERPVLYVSYELEAFEIRARLIAHRTNVFYSKVCTPSRLTIHERERIRAAWGEYGRGDGKRVYVRLPSGEEKGKVKTGSVAWIQAHAQAIREAVGTSPVVIVDYLQPCSMFADGYDAKQVRIAVGKTSLDLRQLSRDLVSPVVILSSIPRNAYLSARKNEGYARPEMDGLKESGDIEFGADAVGFIWPEEQDWLAHEGNGTARVSTDPRPMLFTVVKGRISGTGETFLQWNPPLGLFTDNGTRPAQKEQPSPSAKGKKPDLTIDALGTLIVQNGKHSGEGQWTIETDRLFILSKDYFGAKKLGIEAVLAKHPERFERTKRENEQHQKVPVVIYRRGDPIKPGELVEIFPKGDA